MGQVEDKKKAQVERKKRQKQGGRIKRLLAPWSVAVSVGVAVVAVLVWRARHSPDAFTLRPFSGMRVRDSALFSATYKEQMLWGTYRPGFYCGIRARQVGMPAVGLMWARPGRTTWAQVRHQARNEDNLKEFGWQRHDLRHFGEQRIVDGNVQLDMAFVKNKSSGYGGDWALHVQASGTEASEDNERLSLFFYVALPEGESGAHAGSIVPGQLNDATDVLKPDGFVFASGRLPPPAHADAKTWTSQKWAVVAAARQSDGSPLPPPGSQASPIVAAVSTGDSRAHEAHDVAKSAIVARYQQLSSKGALAQPDRFQFDMVSGMLGGAAGDDSNLVLVQVQAQLPFSLDLSFLSNVGDTELDTPEFAAAARRRHALMSGAELQQLLASKRADFDARFDGMFKPRTTAPMGTREMVQAGLSETLGSMAYMFGSSQVSMPAKPGAPERERAFTEAAPLFTGVPSRSFFPRGFLWDEGFHQLLVQHWDPQASCEALAHWLDLMNADGWIPREMILGGEARMRVPDQFVSQLPEAANPPTLFLPLAALARRLTGKPGLGGHDARFELDQAGLRDFLQRVWPRAVHWFRWFERTQAGSPTGAFRWRGRDAAEQDSKLNPLTLASGLDDFPRASHASADERHVDLRCWVAFMAETLVAIGEALSVAPRDLQPIKQAAARYGSYHDLKALHWDAQRRAFSDWGMHTEDVALTQRVDQTGKAEHVRRLTGKEPTLRFVPHFGYPSLFPLALGILQCDAGELSYVVASIRHHLWTPYGLRSLSPASSLYNRRNTEHDPPYWRGSIWINLNYLVLGGLDRCVRSSQAGGELQSLYQEVREGLLKNMVRQFVRQDSHFVWENYNDTNGGGQGTHPFGWSGALSFLVAVEHY